MIKKLIPFLTVTVLALIFAACGTPEKAEVICGNVNGESITQDELDYFMTRKRADVISYYVTEYGVTDFSDFWDRPFDGKTPSERLYEVSFDEAVRAKTELCLMREYGIYDDISYAGLKIKAEKYNAEHGSDANAVGLQTVNTDNFYIYYISNGRTELQNRLAENILKPTDEETKKFKNGSTDITDELAIKHIVAEKYEKYITELVNNSNVGIE